MQIYHDQVIEAAYLHTKPGCFFIGPFARRVSFASQQRRALDLVRALAAKGKLADAETNKPKTIAVVGAGIAGLTAAVALRGQGCRVHVYERFQEPLNLQREASHRLIHPTISRWPAEELSHTTDVAFLDWFAAPCDVVIESMRRDWNERLAPRESDRDFTVFYGVTVKEMVVSIDVSNDVVRLMTEPEVFHKQFVSTGYDYVIVTTGFAEEEASVPYWNRDDIEKWRRDERQAYISGCGDGGLIDALRLVHADFAGGWLTIRLAQLLGGPIATKIAAAEDEALMAAKSIACMNLRVDEGNAAQKKIGPTYADEAIVRRLGRTYTALARELPEDAKDMLDKSLKRAGVPLGRVNLVSRQSQPFGPYAAPIHKLMIAHAINDGRIRYMQGELTSKDQLTSEDKQHVIRSPTGEDRDIGDAGLIIRHGSPANLAGMLEPAERESLRIRQFMLADYVDPELDREVPLPSGYPRRQDPDGKARYISTRYAMTQRLMADLAPGSTVTADKDGFSYDGADQAPRDPTALPIPKEVFGIRLTEGAIKTVGWL